ncbi:alpha/beta-hydrolase [Cryphonectria parasitica EP155]|uniref:Carboxylic ester hydrolase n=1 Tax=Cryphonectria parasitica (strain ATCC 38755 / EP155) TaxID=660469 RepID=A0A9P5CSG9_CRYP1|nr:alpha/beta-hydrolase [Cryphonectria parasitica EP155]KAF3769293.1 alpha/beta-hydrolase [Cryphonectria parasitica EP155]
MTSSSSSSSSLKTLLACCSLLATGSQVHAAAVHPRDGAVLRSTSSPTVTVKNGSYEGVYSTEYDQDYFLGMRYAEPAQRFELAQPLTTAWNGTQPAKVYPPSCIGYGSDDTGYTLSEDCLYLNVIRPAGIDETAELPVAVWIHGGGLYEGGSADRRYNLSFIVQNSVDLGTPMVAVSLNYRLSAYGFLSGSEALSAGIANNGFRDQRQALRWVNENIAAFGGDPNKVTIWGESSGAESVNAQVLAYNGRDDGLFRAAIAESGFGGTLPRYAGGFNATDAMQAVYNTLVANTSCAATVNTTASLDCLKALPFDELDAALNGTAASPWPPMLDHDFIADYPIHQLAAGRFPQIPIMIGCNTDEGTAFGDARGPNGSAVNTDEEMRYAVESIIGAQAPELLGRTMDSIIDEALTLYPDIQAVGIPSLEKFPVILPGDEVATTLGLQYRRTGAFFGDLYLRRRASIAWFNAGLPSWAYRFDVTVNGVPDYVAATHFQEVAFVFDNTLGVGYDAAPDPFANTTAAFPALAKAMSNAWVNFITGLDPNGAAATAAATDDTWPQYNATSGGGVGQSIVFSVNGSYIEWDDYRAEGINWMIQNSLPLFGN